MNEGNAAGRRERKKAATRDRLVKVALELFQKEGYPQTTVQQITEAADVSERTFFRYFQSKEDLLLPNLIGFFERVENELLARPIDEAPLVALKEALVSALATRVDDIIELPLIRPFQTGQSALGMLARSFIDWEIRLSDVIVQRLTATSEYGPKQMPSVLFFADVTSKVGLGALRAGLRQVFIQQPDDAQIDAAMLIEAVSNAFDVALGAGILSEI